MNIYLIPYSIVLLLFLFSVCIHFEFDYLIFAFELPMTAFNLNNNSNILDSNLITNLSKFTGNESHINSLVNISSNKGNSELPKFAVTGKNISILWLDDSSGYRDLYFKRSIDGGKTFEKSINLGNIPGGAYDHQIAVINNYVFVIWEQSPENNGQIFFKRSTDWGKTFEKSINLGNNTGLSGTPQIAVSKGNSTDNDSKSVRVYIIWHDSSEGIVVRNSVDAGSTFEKTISISENNPLAFFPKITTQDNNVYAVWITIYNKGLENETKEVSFAKSNNGGISFDKVTNLTNDAKISFNAQLASSDNNVYVVWTNGTFVKDEFPILTDSLFTYSNDSGNSFHDTISLNNFTGWSSNPMIKTSNDKIYIVWEERSQNRDGDIFLCIMSIKEAKKCNYKINVSNDSNNSYDPSFDISNNSTLVAWTNQDFNYSSSIIIKKIIYPLKNIDEKETTLSDNSSYFLNPQVVISDSSSDVFVIWNGDSFANDEIYLANLNYSNIEYSKVGVSNNKNEDMNRTSDLDYKVDNYLPSATSGIKYPNNSISINNFDGTSIALVDPTFTNAAYNNAFYIFYNLYNNYTFYQNSTKYLNLLTSKIDRDLLPSFTVLYLQNHISNLMPNANVTIISDVDVQNKNIFNNDSIMSNKYDAIILEHQEYVTQEEYNNLRQFVANGGILILPYSNIFYAEIKYDPADDTIVLVKGHNWEFDGKTAKKSVAERWLNETSEWIGSSYSGIPELIFGNNPFGYLEHEEQYITNPKVKILLDYNVTIPTKYIDEFHDFRIATYEHNYKKGKVIDFGIYPSSDLLNNDRFNRFLDSILLKYVN